MYNHSARSIISLKFLVKVSRCKASKKAKYISFWNKTVQIRVNNFMEDKAAKLENAISAENHHKLEIITLFPGIDLYFGSSCSKQFSCHHPKWEDILSINYCAAGRISWNMGNNKQVFLGPGDFSIHTMDSCSESFITLPTEYYEGIAIWVDFSEIDRNTIPLLSELEFSLKSFVDKYCPQGTFSSFAGNSVTNSIFEGFYQKPGPLGLALQKVKCLELLLYLLQMPLEQSRRLTEYQSELVEIIHKIHNVLVKDMKKRVKIEELAKQYAINPTTLKGVYKSVYGNSIAAHIKAHRMELAAKLLRETDNSIAQISKAVGYESQSKFTSAFKEHFHILPTDYRKIK